MKFTRRPPDATLNSAKFAQATGFAPCGVRPGIEMVRRGLAPTRS